MTTLNTECKSNHPILNILDRTQERADTGMPLHALDATRVASSICFHTDVLVLLLLNYQNLCPGTSLLTGTGHRKRNVPLGPVHAALGAALSGFHTFTCCVPQHSPGQSFSPCSGLPTSYWWQREGDCLVPISTVLPPAYKALLHLVKCGCKEACRYADMCTCCEANM